MERKLLLLGLLRKQEMHGYQLYEFIDRYLSTCTDMKKSTAYYLLNKMGHDEWITEEVSQEGNRPPRRVYRLTPKGEVAFQQLLRENLTRYDPAHFTGDVGIAFIDEIDPEESLALLVERRKKMLSAQEETEKVPEHSGSMHWVIEHQRHHIAAELVWMDKVIQQLAGKVA
jgi:DNA-binding PadR family transcriptional regulator